MDRGLLLLDKDTSAVLPAYQGGVQDSDIVASDPDAMVSLDSCHRRGTGKGRFLSARVRPLGPDGLAVPYAYPGTRLRIDLLIQCISGFPGSNVGIEIYDAHGYRIIDANIALKRRFLPMQAGELARVRIELHDLLLKPGNYLIGLWLGRAGIENIDYLERALSFSVETDSENVVHTELFPGVYQCRFEASIEKIVGAVN